MRGIYFYRGHTIFHEESGGWTTDISGNFNIYNTLFDAKQAIKKLLDGTNTKDPKVIGEMDFSEYTVANKKVNYIYYNEV